MKSGQHINQGALHLPFIDRINWPITMALSCVLLISIAQISMKWGVMQFSHFPPELVSPWQQSSLFESALTDVITQNKPLFQFSFIPLLFIFTGLMCYALSMACWIVALKQLPLSIAYPLLSLSYIIVYFAAISLPGLNETFNGIKLLGIICILVGLYLMTRQNNSSTTQNTQ
ncbi:4-amino-4-deoxy-L-arabinose-phosphoundecaprenol flippase subunit ArnF [uncultured Shewanella sp.]|uniref:4-amino-4-deoxy-L-arabinose-phosphoundecaprenol flippase subunit ArnF n=1 Tax=uncultured Shewanella sp. TaxID=173975 RepID=UPI00261C78B1|nr:4-amino-4-deoxy-L-arabinose-phosphoundecaprenol flippase subunit ArnF [uncultured Shewanella sp.]